ncbi:hypothetical protein EPN81_00160 [Patescibacteria group bacterium]|nr:MAG: hypothetical protein EPN81_00160 [Patescibacteria group bacterium]
MSPIMTLGPSLIREEEPDANKTIFGRFLLAIRNGQTLDQPISGDRVVWCDEPVELIALSGLWVIMHKLASLSGESINTMGHAQQIAEWVNRLVSAGIVFVHETPEAAGEAFRTQVLHLTRQAHTLGYRPGMEVPVQAWSQLSRGNKDAFVRALTKERADKPGNLLDYWQAPSTLFFAPLVKAARDLRERLLILKRDVATRNFVHESTYFKVFVSYEAEVALSIAQGVLDFLDEIRGDAKLVPESLRDAEAGLAEVVSTIDLFRRFRIQPDRWPATSSDMTLDTEWLTTQMLLSYTDKPHTADFLVGASLYRSALLALQAQDDQTVVERVIKRLSTRVMGKPPLTAQEEQILINKIKDRLHSLRTWDPPLIDDHVVSSMLFEISDREFYLDPETAYEVAAGMQLAILERVRSSGLDTNLWLKGVGMAMNWPALTRAEVQDIMTEAVLPDTVILDGLALRQPEVGKQEAQKLLRLHPAPRTLNHAIRLVFIELDVDTIRENVDILDPEILGEHLAFMLDQVSTTKNGEYFIPTLWTALTRAGQSWVEGLLRDRNRRPALCDAIKLGLEDETIKWNRPAVDKLRENIGENTFHRLILGAVARFRDILRRSPEFDGETSWVNVIGAASSSEVDLRVLGKKATPADARRILKATPEATALAWANGETD